MKAWWLVRGRLKSSNGFLHSTCCWWRWSLLHVYYHAPRVGLSPNQEHCILFKSLYFLAHSLMHYVNRWPNLHAYVRRLIKVIISQYTNHRHAIWLFLMELARRRWGARPRSETERAANLLQEAGSPFKEIENEIWEQRVHFAAAIARIRIKNKAFS